MVSPRSGVGDLQLYGCPGAIAYLLMYVQSTSKSEDEPRFTNPIMHVSDALSARRSTKVIEVLTVFPYQALDNPYLSIQPSYQKNACKQHAKRRRNIMIWSQAKWILERRDHTPRRRKRNISRRNDSICLWRHAGRHDLKPRRRVQRSRSQKLL